MSSPAISRTIDADLTGPADEPPPYGPDPPSSPEALFDAYADFAYRTLRGLGLNAADAEDALQEVFLVAHRRAAEGASFFLKSWIFRVAINVGRNARRKGKRSLTAEVDPDTLVDGRDPGPLQHTLQRERCELLHALLAQLDEPLRAVFLASEVEQMTGPEIAAALALPLSTVKYRIATARQKLEAALRRHQVSQEWGLP